MQDHTPEQNPLPAIRAATFSQKWRKLYWVWDALASVFIIAAILAASFPYWGLYTSFFTSRDFIPPLFVVGGILVALITLVAHVQHIRQQHPADAVKSPGLPMALATAPASLEMTSSNIYAANSPLAISSALTLQAAEPLHALPGAIPTAEYKTTAVVAPPPLHRLLGEASQRSLAAQQGFAGTHRNQEELAAEIKRVLNATQPIQLKMQGSMVEVLFTDRDRAARDRLIKLLKPLAAIDPEATVDNTGKLRYGVRIAAVTFKEAVATKLGLFKPARTNTPSPRQLTP